MRVSRWHSRYKTDLLHLSKELGNISQTRKIMGISCDTFDHYQQVAEQDGVEIT